VSRVRTRGSTKPEAPQSLRETRRGSQHRPHDATLTVLEGWRAFQGAEFTAVGIDYDEGWVFTDGDGDPCHPHNLPGGEG
jgi:hypothetical protein